MTGQKPFFYLSRVSDLPSENTPHFHSGVEIHFIIDGVCALYIHNECHLLEKNTVCVISPQLAHHVDCISEACCRVSLLVNWKNSEKISPKSADVGIYCNGIFSSIKDNVHYAVTHKTDASAEANENLLLDVNNFCKNLTIKAISTHIGYNPEYTAKKIEKIFGMKYSRLLVKLRMSYAREQLGATEKTLEEIAALVGYQSYNGFHIAFKKYYGQTPEQIRNTLRGQARNDQI